MQTQYCHMKQCLVICMTLAYALTSNAQSIQNGLVKEYNGEKTKKALAGVELVVSNAGSNVSDNYGKFMLQFKTLKPGDRVVVNRIEKKGYEIFNKDALESWRIANDGSTFVVVLCKSKDFKRLKDLYYSISSENYARQKQKEEALIAEKLKEGEIRETEYYHELERIRNFYDEQIENLDNYIDRFARIDLNEISKEESKIINLVKEGRIEEAIKAYESLNLEKKYTEINSAIEKEKASIEKLERDIEKKKDDKNNLFSSLMRKYDMLLLAGGRDNLQKIRDSIVELTKANKNELSLQIYAGSFFADILGEEKTAIEYFNNVCSHFDEDDIAKEEYIQALYNLSICYDNIGESDKALEMCDTFFSTLQNSEYASDNHYWYKYYVTLSKIYLTMNRYDDVANNVEKAQSYLDENGIHSTEWLSTKALFMFHIGDYEKSCQYYEEALSVARLEPDGGNKEPVISDILNNYSLALKNADKLKESIAMLDEAEKLVDNKLGRNKLLGILINKSTYFAEIGDLESSKTTLLKAKELADEIYDGDHLSKMTILLNIAHLSVSEGKYEEALSTAASALSMSKRLYGEQHSAIAEAYNLYAYIYSNMGDYQKAEQYSDYALSISEQVYGTDSPKMIPEYINVGTSFSINGDLERAKSVYDKALKIALSAYGENNLSVADIYSHLAAVYNKEKQYSDAEKCLQKSIQIMQYIYGDKKNANLFSNYKSLGSLYSKVGKFDEASEFLKLAMDIALASYGEDSIEMASLCNEIGFNCYDRHDFGQAIIYLEKTLAIYTKIFGRKNTKTYSAYANLAGIYMMAGEYEKALSNLESMQETRVEMYGYYSKEVAKALDNKAILYKHMGDTQAMIKIYDEMLSIYEKVSGTDSDEYQNTLLKIEQLKSE